MNDKFYLEKDHDFINIWCFDGTTYFNVGTTITGILEMDTKENSVEYDAEAIYDELSSPLVEVPEAQARALIGRSTAEVNVLWVTYEK